ncbi:class III lanthionine synthetase LanKC [Nocardiopsis ansamitocini]|uniref:Serine/threonine protein kinase n=1 Tax=Nocardiopsis ansamitocini TaxID=1670832 RepID=A0A9W6PAM3_9ACTN|nr:class III lanthionine synthetase LanKC [Nocardiopsis ansamitocini]GLU50032.1 serine/threonine protein kinase [Nocardiopsis ansamitocini]
MLDRVEVYTQADPLFYEDPRRWTGGPAFLGDGEFSISGLDCPSGWVSGDQGVWRYLFPEGADLPEQGWKIHVSATLDNAEEICEAVREYCVARRIPFKYLMNRRIQFVFSAKYAPRASSGKLVTIYPRDEKELESILVGLSEKIGGEPGPYILSDLRWGQGPLYVRYGGFAEMRCTGADGELVPAIRRPDGALVPDLRQPAFSPPAWVEMPDFLKPHLRTGQNGEAQQPYRVLKALHFSNGGGVYLAERLTDGMTVVLKEARPHAGLDGNGDDAVARQEREEKALTRLDGISGVPGLLDSFPLGGHRFLVQEYAEGLPLYSWCAAFHPWVNKADPDDEEVADYTRRALRIMDRLKEIVGEVHKRGLVFGDLHVNNVLVDADDTVTLIDFEQSFDAADAQWKPGLGAPGFNVAQRRGTAIDDYGMAALRLVVFMLFSPITVLDSAKAAEFVAIVRRNFPVPPEWADEIEAEMVPEGTAAASGQWPPAAAPSPAAIAAGVLASATPERRDRLFPGDIQQFVSGGFGFAHGAAGVLWALDTAGHGRHPDHEQWLIDAGRRLVRPNPGFYDGVAGLAYALDHLGYGEEAADLLERHADAPSGGMSLFSGLSGVGATLLHFADSHGDARYRERAVALADRLAGFVENGPPEGAERASSGRTAALPVGLMRGWSGIALFFVRMYEQTADPACLDAAVRAIHRDLDHCVTSDDDALLVKDKGARALPYLEAGGMGIALVAGDLLAHREDARVREAVPGLCRSALARLTVRADLFFGKAGQLVTLARMGGAPEAVEERARELAAYTLPYRGHVAFPGGRGIRLSMDLATGGAGILLALATARGQGAPFLPFFSARGCESSAGGNA